MEHLTEDHICFKVDHFSMESLNTNLSCPIQSLDDINRLRDKLTKAYVTVNTLNRENGQLKEQVSVLQDEITSLEKDQFQLEIDYLDQKALIASLKGDIENLQTSKTASSQNNTMKGTGMCSQSVGLMEEYSLFCTTFWLDAKCALDDWMRDTLPEGDINTSQLLLDALFHCYDLAKQLLRDTKQHISSVVENPLQSCVLSSKCNAAFGLSYQCPPSNRDTTDHNICNLDKDLSMCIVDNLRSHIEHIEFEKYSADMAQQYMAQIPALASAEKLLSDKFVLAYFSESMRLCWSMLLHKPEMRLVCDGKVGSTFDPKSQDLSFGSADPLDDKAIVGQHIHPGLYNGNEQIFKTRVWLTVPK